MGSAASFTALHADVRSAFEAAGLADASLEARFIIEHYTSTSRIDLLVRPDLPVAGEIVDKIWAAVDQRLTGMPVHRIFGAREFYGRAFKLSPATLEPRPDTEILIDVILPYVFKITEKKGRCRILDIGAGTGVIGITLLCEAANTTAVGVDISAAALEIAAQNADLHGVVDRYSTCMSDWFENVAGEFDIIVSNPPYICTSCIVSLAPEVRFYDPLVALDGGADGVSAYRCIAEKAHHFLAADGILGVEIGFDQKSSVGAIFAAHGFSLQAASRDLGGNDRVMIFSF